MKRATRGLEALAAKMCRSVAKASIEVTDYVSSDAVLDNIAASLHMLV